MIILVGSTKGGAGKSTAVTNIATVLAHQKKEILLFDADRQPTSSEWETERRLNQLECQKITCVQRYGDIDATIQELAKKYANIIIDVAGRDSDEFRSALIVADVVLVPIRPSQADLNAFHSTIRLIVQARRINPKLIAYCFLNQAPTNAKGKEIELAKEFISDYPEIKVLSTNVYDRKVYRDALSEGLGVIEMSGKSDSEKSARNEILALVEEAGL